MRAYESHSEMFQRKTSNKDNMAKLRQRTVTVENAILVFEHEIKLGPDFVCTCCHRMMYRKVLFLVNTCFQHINSLGSIAHICAHLFRTFGSIAHICARSQFTFKKHNPCKLPRLFTFFRGTSATVRSASAIHHLQFAVRAGFPTCNNAHASASGRLDTAPLLYAGSAYAVQWINSRREYPTKKRLRYNGFDSRRSY